MTDYSEADALYDAIGTRIFREEFRSIYASLRSSHEEGPWEYGTVRDVVDGWERGDRYGDKSYVDARSVNERPNHDPSTVTGVRPLGRTVRRRKAGEWERVNADVSISD